MNSVRVTVLVAHGYFPTELALVQDALRVAGQLSADVSFDLDACTPHDEGLLEGMGGTFVRAIPFKFKCAVPPNHLVVLGGSGIRAEFDTLKSHLSWMECLGFNITLLSDAAAEWKRLYSNMEQVTTLWENQELERDAGRAAADRLPFFTQKSRVTSGGSMASTADLVLT